MDKYLQSIEAKKGEIESLENQKYQKELDLEVTNYSYQALYKEISKTAGEVKPFETEKTSTSQVQKLSKKWTIILGIIYLTLATGGIIFLPTIIPSLILWPFSIISIAIGHALIIGASFLLYLNKETKLLKIVHQPTKEAIQLEIKNQEAKLNLLSQKKWYLVDSIKTIKSEIASLTEEITNTENLRTEAINTLLGGLLEQQLAVEESGNKAYSSDPISFTIKPKSKTLTNIKGGWFH